MRRHVSWILFPIALALGLYVYFVEIRGAEQRELLEERVLLLFPGVEQTEIQELAMSSLEELPVKLLREGEGWRLEAPLSFPADASVVRSLLSTLASLSVEDEIDAPQATSVYGLDARARVLRFRTADGRQRALRIGNSSPVGNRTYVARDEERRVFLIPSGRLNGLQRHVGDLRDRRPARFAPESIDRVVLEWRDGSVRVERRDGDWRLIEPSVGKLAPAVLDRLLAQLAQLRAQEFVDEALNQSI